MTVNEIRRNNINTWADKLGRNLLAQKLGYPDTNYINQLCSGSGSFGSRTARRVETALSLPIGWMDIAHDLDNIESLSPAPKTEAAEYSVPLIAWSSIKERGQQPYKPIPGDAEEWMPKPKNAGRNTFALTVKDDTYCLDISVLLLSGQEYFADNDGVLLTGIIER